MFGMAKTAPYLNLLRNNRDFRKLWGAQLISMGGDWFNSVALLGLVLDLTGSGFYAGLILASSMISLFLGSPIAGVVADRFDRKRVMLLANLVAAALALGMLLVRSPETIWIGVVCMAGIALTGSFISPASGASLPNLVTPGQLGPASVLMGSSFGIMLAVGAALGGLVAATLGGDAAFAANAASFLLAAGLIVRIRRPFGRTSRSATGFRPVRDLADGISYARSDRRVIALLAQKAGFGLAAGMVGLLALFATQVFRAGDAGIGALFAARGVGVVLGPLGARAFVKDDQRRLFLATAGSMAILGLGYLAFPAMPNLWAALPVLVIAHLGGGAQWVLVTYGLQCIAPDHVRGRILAFELGLVMMSMSVSLLTAGRAAELVSPRTVVEIVALLFLAYAGAWLWRTRSLWTRPAKLCGAVGVGAEPIEQPLPSA
jgi:MFS family permease